MKKLSSLGLAATLSLSLLAPTVGVHATTNATATTATTFTVNFKGTGLPANVKEIIEQAGGTIVKSSTDLSYVQAVSTKANFLDLIRANDAVETAGRTLVIKQEAVAVEPFTESTTTSSDHPLYDAHQWDIKQVTENGKSFDISKGSKNVVVGVIDTGVDLNHPDLAANIVDAKSFVPGEESPIDANGHGTHVAGSIAANGKSLGIGPNLGIGALRVFGKSGGATTQSIAEALRYAADHDYDVVNMSLGGYYFLQDPESSASDIRAEMNLFKKAIAYAHKKGVTVVGSAGNAGADIHSPGGLAREMFDENGAAHRDPSSNLLIRVSAGNAFKQLTFYSNYGQGKIDVMAPGGDLGPNYDPSTGAGRDRSYLCFSTVPVLDQQKNIIGHGYAYYAGTSMAAPKVAGVAGVIISKYGKNKLSPAQVKHIIEASAEDIYKTGKDPQSGSGYVNALSALTK